MKQAKKLSENEVLTELIYYKKEGSPIVVSSTKVTKSQIEAELTMLNDRLSHWNSLNPQEYVNGKIQEAQRRKDEYSKMQQAIDGEINDTIIIEAD